MFVEKVRNVFLMGEAFKRFFSAVVYAIFVFNTHPINRISKAGAAIVNTISS